MKETTMKYDAIVVGGGIAGLTAAAYMAKNNKTVALYEKQAKLGGLVQTFHRDGVYFDGGLRSIENSGIVFPMLKQLGIDLEWVKSPIAIGVGDSVLRLKDNESIHDYEKFLIEQFPESEKDVKAIIKEIRKIMGYMDVLYGIDNPAFMDMMADKKYLFKTVIPWLFKFMFTIRKITRLDEPVEEFLAKITKNQALIDSIAQHFFKHTPTSFALSYFSLYLDYFYPKGGTGTVIESIGDFIRENGGEIFLSNPISTHNPEEKYIIDSNGEKVYYNSLIWAADLKQLYKRINLDELRDNSLVKKIEDKKAEIADLRGGDSLFMAFLTVDLGEEYFAEKCTGHTFYTPSKEGLSSIDHSFADRFIKHGDESMKEELKAYLIEHCDKNTFEIAIPVLRDSSLAPKGKAGVVISYLFDYMLTKKIEELGWTMEMKALLEDRIIEVMDNSLFPGIKDKVSAKFSSTPLTIEFLTDSSEGGITGWAFTNPIMPVTHKMMDVNKAVDTIMPDVYQAGQWSYSPAGFPISILTGKLATDKALKKFK